MKLLQSAMMGFVAAMFLALAAAPAHAKTLVCKTKKGHTDVFHDGTDGSHCESVTEDGTCTAQSKATGASSFSESTCDKHGKVKASANGDHADGQAQAFGPCHASGKAIGPGSTANARCEAGGFAHATATNGGTADAFDDAPPVCTAGGGTAAVHSTGGDCSAP
jgi:hypothetical protein